MVDDEEDFRSLARQILEDHGYRVLDAGNGRELAERFGWFRPHAKVLFMTGYANEVVGRYGIFTSDRPVIEKPFTPEGLTRTVRRLIDT